MKEADPVRASILIVDDVPANLHLLSRILVERGYRYRVATSGERALAAIAAAPPELVMLDITMPGIDGYEVCRRLKADPSTADIPVIFVSALDGAIDKVRAFESGGADYVPKPFHFEEVVARIEHQLRISRLQRDLEERNRELAAANRELVRLSTTDALTGVANRRRIHEHLDDLWLRRDTLPVSVVLLDVDHFKQYNDTYGHQRGDHCLQAVAGAIAAVTGERGLVGRYGGEEFLVVLTGLDDDATGLLAEEIRRAIEALAIEHGSSGAAPVVTVSLGVAAAGDHEHPDQLVARADEDLYGAKRVGRNRVGGARSRAVGRGDEGDRTS